MLSILIPIYNFHAYPLVHSLEKQLSKSGIEFEIICADDASRSSVNEENEKINILSNSKFFSNKKNLGYSSNRNFLASISKFDHLLFIDGDSIVISKDYINNYLNSIPLTDTDIVYGGRVHPNSIENPKKKLRWKYGRLIEDKSATARSKSKYKTLRLNNTLMKRTVLEKIKFDPSTDKYGHDDTLFAYQASLLKLKVKHIENAVMHGDIDNNNIFLKKTETALANLFTLYESGKISTSFVKILKFYNAFRRLKAHVAICFLFKTFRSHLINHLLSGKPSLLVLNLYKIGFLSSINRNTRQ